MNYHSKPARLFSAQYGNGLNEYEECLLHRLVRQRRTWKKLYGDYRHALRLGWSVNQQDHMGNSVLDAAIDAYRFKESCYQILRLLLRENPSHQVLVTALGNLLSRYDQVGSVTLDKGILSCLRKLGTLSKEDCDYLFLRALHGAAWPYLLPFWEGTGFPARENLPWEDELALYLDDRQTGKQSFFSLPPEHRDFSPLGFTTGSAGILRCVLIGVPSASSRHPGWAVPPTHGAQHPKSFDEPPGEEARSLKQVKHVLFQKRSRLSRGLKKRAKQGRLTPRDIAQLLTLFL